MHSGSLPVHEPSLSVCFLVCLFSCLSLFLYVSFLVCLFFLSFSFLVCLFSCLSVFHQKYWPLWGWCLLVFNEQYDVTIVVLELFDESTLRTLIISGRQYVSHRGGSGRYAGRLVRHCIGSHHLCFFQTLEQNTEVRAHQPSLALPPPVMVEDI